MPGASKSQIWASILKDKEITVARIRQAKSALWTYDFQYKPFGGQVKMSFGQALFIIFVLYLPKWASGDKNLCHTLQASPFFFFFFPDVLNKENYSFSVKSCVQIHWASKETYHFFRVTLSKIQSINMNHIWTQFRQICP